MKSVCIIDDDPIYQMLAKRLISLNQYSDVIFDYRDGNEAYLAIKQMHDQGEKMPDVIFLDINMPIWDGWDFLDEIIKLELQHLFEIYMVSSSTNSYEKEKAESYPLIKGFLTKPLEIEALKLIL
jgi:CheY-like chemotaxis protein